MVRPGATAGFTARIDSDESARVDAADVVACAAPVVRAGTTAIDAAVAAMAVVTARRLRIVSSMV